MNDLCGISATQRRGNEEISVETRFRGQCRSQSWNPYGPVLGYRSRLLGFHRSLGSEAVSSSGVRWVPWVPTRARGRLPILSVLGPTFQSTIVDRLGRSIMCCRHVRRSAFGKNRCQSRRDHSHNRDLTRRNRFGAQNGKRRQSEPRLRPRLLQTGDSGLSHRTCHRLCDRAARRR